MSDLIESRLRNAMSEESRTPSDGWSSIVDGADKLERRDRLTQRISVLGFVALLASSLVAIGRSAGVDTVEPTSPSNDGTADAVVSSIITNHLHVGLALVAVLTLGFVAAASSRPVPSQSPRWLLLVVIPVLYPIVSTVLVPISSANDLRLIPAASKLLTIPCIPILFFHLAGRVGERPSRAAQAFGVWSVLGLSVVLIARGLIDDIVRTTNEPLGTFRLWPEDFGHNSDHGEIALGLEQPPGLDWVPEAMLRNELIGVVVLALLASSTLWLLRNERLIFAVAMPVVMWLGLVTFQLFTPVGLALDYDFFLGDIALSAVLFDLSLFFYPTDIVGMSSISAAAISMGGLLWLWGGPRQSGD